MADDRHNWIFYFVVATGAGILFRSFFVWGMFFVVATLLVAIVATIVFYLRKQHLFFVLALVLFGFSLGLLRMECAELRDQDSRMVSALGTQVSLVGVIQSEPDLRDRNQLVVLSVSQVNDMPATGRVLVSADRFEPLSYGARVRVAGELVAPENFETDSGRVFNYVKFLAKDDIAFRMLYPAMEVLEYDVGNPLLSNLFNVKQMFLEALTDVLPEPEVSLLGGLLLGAKQSLGVELLEAFRVTGLIHIIVLSGYNISIIMGAVMWLFAFLPIAVSVGLGGVFVILFAIMTGGSASIVRASLMAILILVARMTGRVYEVTRALFITGFLMLMHNPQLLAFDPSFQLSFLATLGLIQLAPRLERYVVFVPQRLGLRESLIATLATQAAVLPLLLYQTGVVSVVAIFANLLVLPVVPFAMLLGFITGLFALLSSTLALPFAFLTDALLSYILVVTEALSSFPVASFTVRTFPFYAMAMVYLIVFGSVYFLLNRIKN